jgi:hypothetical protein
MRLLKRLSHPAYFCFLGFFLSRLFFLDFATIPEYIVFDAVFDALLESEVKRIGRTIFDTLSVKIPPQKSVFHQTTTQII